MKKDLTRESASYVRGILEDAIEEIRIDLKREELEQRERLEEEEREFERLEG